MREDCPSPYKETNYPFLFRCGMLNKAQPVELNVVSHPIHRYAVWFEGSVLASTPEFFAITNGLSKLFDAAGLGKFCFPVSRMSKNVGEWPTVADMVQQNQ
ncbi:hypothetical protein CQW23_13755 [Capsicum baccatum]|uniref:Uncharacterized protein n=1 Tax=Capsicum baccatum TaxID=33114 RepID=A0A2G2WH66_CAPBA|nr:hypothetical protein CQW23_13755 [Capsicum baccatum]